VGTQLPGFYRTRRLAVECHRHFPVGSPCHPQAAQPTPKTLEKTLCSWFPFLSAVPPINRHHSKHLFTWFLTNHWNAISSLVPKVEGRLRIRRRKGDGSRRCWLTLPDAMCNGQREMQHGIRESLSVIGSNVDVVDTLERVRQSSLSVQLMPARIMMMMKIMTGALRVTLQLLR